MTKEKEHKKTKFCPECGKHMKENSEGSWFCPDCGYKHEKTERVIVKKEKSIVSSICGGLIILFLILFFIGLFVDDSETKTQQQSKLYIEDTYKQLNEIFRSGSKYTDLQKDKIFEEQYKGKYVKWSGKVRDIDASMLDNLRLYVNIKENIIFDDYVVVYMNKDQYNKLIELNKDDDVTFSGKFDSYVTVFGVTFYFKDGELIS